MLREYNDILRRLLIFLDLCIVSASFFLSCFLRNIFQGFQPLETWPWFLPTLLFVWGFMLYRARIYDSFRTKDISELIYIIFKSAFFGLLIFSGIMYYLKTPHINRNFIALVFITTTAFLCLEKAMLKSSFWLIRKRGYNFRNILIIGSNKRVGYFIGLIKEHAEWGFRIIGIVEDEASKLGQEVKGVKIIGLFKDIPDIIHNYIVDEVIFIVPRSWLNKIKDIVDLCEIEGIKVRIAVDFFDLRFAKIKQSDLGGFPLLTFETTSDKLWHLFIKRFIDVVFSGIGLVLLLPLFIIVALFIKLTSPGPVFFIQQRSSLNGRKFNLYKFRTMVSDAESKLSGLIARNEMQGPVFKMKDDPRVTPLGKLLRKLSLDELPQLWNVFIGDMSLVGPRPPLPSEINQYDNWHRRKLSMRPGITCLWQISGRNNITDFDEWMRLDLEYIDNWSLWLDSKILLKTMPVVFFGIGAK